MAIQFARFEAVKRTSGKNACQKSAYNSRDRVYFEGTKFSPAKTYNYSNRQKTAFSDVLLPINANEKFKNRQYLWNTIEKLEKRKDSQIAFEFVFALPDDKIVSIKQKVEMIKMFVEMHFVSKGLVVQLDIHVSDKDDRNWHAHALMTTREVNESGDGFSLKKASGILDEIKKGKVIKSINWGKIWADFQNWYFKTREIDLIVDPIGIVPQIHEGCVRMRGKAHSLFSENESRIELNKIESLDAQKILDKIVKHCSVFDKKTVEFYILKHVEKDYQEDVRENFWKLSSIIPLLSLRTKNQESQIEFGESGLYTVSQVFEEEKKILRLSDRIHNKTPITIKDPIKVLGFASHLNNEQKEAFVNVVNGKQLVCINGDAGTGKSTLLSSLKNAYEYEGFVVRAFGPDTATCKVLEEKGFTKSENIHKFLFNHVNGNRDISKSREIWIVDESSKISNPSLLEFLKVAEKNKAKVIFCGDTKQLAPVGRGEMFSVFTVKYGAQSLIDIQRQQTEEQRLIAKAWADKNSDLAIDMLITQGNISFAENKVLSIRSLVTHWANDEKIGVSDFLIIAQKQQEINILNDTVHLIRKLKGELGDRDYHCHTSFGDVVISEGDLIEFRLRDEKLGVLNGDYGVLVSAEKNKFVVTLKGKDGDKQITFDPVEYCTFSLGYATTLNRSQGRTVDNVYVLHCPQMRLDSYYVGFTRHRKTVNCFVSKTECPDINTLKDLAGRTRDERTTYGYVSQYEAEQYMRYQELKNSSRMFDKLKLWGIDTFESFDFIQKYVDRLKDKQFFNPDVQRFSGHVENVASDFTLQREIVNTKFFEMGGEYQLVQKKELVDSYDVLYQKQGNVNNTLSDVDVQKINIIEFAQEIFDGLNIGEIKHKKKILCESHKVKVDKFFESVATVSSYTEILNAQEKSLGKPKQTCPIYADWLNACKERNAQAYELLNNIPNDQLKDYLGEKAYMATCQKAEFHRKSFDKIKNKMDFEEQIKANIDKILYGLFPEGPITKDSRGFRFGSKGSLSVCCTGDKIGTYYDFDNKEGGGIVKLVQKIKDCDRQSAVSWINELIANDISRDLTRSFQFKNSKTSNDKWICLIPEDKPPSLESISRHLAKVYKEDARHSYRNEDGRLIYERIRLVKNDNSKEKLVLPLSYGKFDNLDSKPHWKLKDFKEEKSMLYGLDLLAKHPDKIVLVVEGEKTADAANKLLGNDKYIAITWAKGSSSVLKADWEPLIGRDVIIWPDNDKSGFQAKNDLRKELIELGVKSLKSVDDTILSKELPEKWDLADHLPSHLDKSFVKDMLLNANIDYKLFNTSLRTSDDLLYEELARKITVLKFDILSLRHQNNSIKIRDDVKKQIHTLMNSRDKMKQDFMEKGISNDLSERLANIVTLQKAIGKNPTDDQIKITQDRLNNFEKVLDLGQNNSFSTFFFDKTIANELYAIDIEKFKNRYSKELDSFQNLQLLVETNKQKSHSKGYDIEL